MNTIEEDFERFSKQHSWYKHLPVPWNKKESSEKFYIVLRKGQQPGCPNPEVDDSEGMHWGFYTRGCIKALNLKVDEKTFQYPIHCNAFLRGVEGGDHPHIRNYPKGFGDCAFLEWLSQTHPDLTNLTDENTMELFRREKNKSKQEAIEAARNLS